MDAKEFVACWKAEKDSTIKMLRSGESLAACQLQELGLSKEKERKLWVALDNTLTDVFYTLLLGLDGCAQIGEEQQTFQIRDEAGNLISQGGDLEAEAYEQFHNAPESKDP
jgi:hypothetical protein